VPGSPTTSPVPVSTFGCSPASVVMSLTRTDGLSAACPLNELSNNRANTSGIRDLLDTKRKLFIAEYSTKSVDSASVQVHSPGTTWPYSNSQTGLEQPDRLRTATLC
jgi:hypothetical protein